MFEKIIVASELSSEMDEVIRSMLDLKKFGANEFVILQCIDPDQKLNQLKQLVTQVYKENLERVKTMLQEIGFIATDILVDGYLKKAIHQVASEENCSLMVVGARSISKLGDLLWGGAAHEVIHHMSKPVLQIRTGSGNPQNIFDHIL